MKTATMRSLLLSALLLCLPAHAGGLDWEDLSPGQQQVLAAQQEGWAGLDEAKQETLARGAQRWLDMSPQQRGQARERLARWKRMNPAEQQQVLREREAFRKRPAAQRDVILEGRELYDSLSEDGKRDAKRRFEERQRTNLKLRCALSDPSKVNAAECAKVQ